MIWGLIALATLLAGLGYAIFKSGILNERLNELEKSLKDKKVRAKHDSKIDSMVLDSLSSLNDFLRKNREHAS